MINTLSSTTLGIDCLKMKTYPQIKPILKSYAYSVTNSKALLRTAFNSIQVLDKKGENTLVHRKVLPLSTTAI